MTPEQQAVKDFLDLALTPAGAGAIVWAVAGWAFHYVPSASRTWKTCVTLALSLLVPPLAYGLHVKLFEAGGFDFTTLLYYVGVGYMVSQIVHEGTQAVRHTAKHTVAAIKGRAVDPALRLQTTTARLTDVPGIVEMGHNDGEQIPRPVGKMPGKLDEPKPFGHRPTKDAGPKTN